jgi:Calcineurin-like phosphoesterase
MPSSPRQSSTPQRYAHPFFTDAAPAQRPQTAFGRRMADFAQTHLGTVPAPRTPSAVLDLADVIGADGVAEIQTAGELTFHAVGDTGRPKGASTSQEDVALQMAGDYSPAAGANNPGFFLHLGDVVYGPNKDQMYRDEFYRPYMKYPGKILAIPGNHDGEVFAGTDPESLRAFIANFCALQATIPDIAGQVRIFRQTMIQPGVYFRLTAPFVDIVALYTNIAEGPGSLLGANGDAAQTTWLAGTLAAIAEERTTGARKALVLATHHPPFSNAGHSGSPELIAQIDEACTKAGVVPDAVISGHAHNYQRHTRASDGGTYIVAGCGGNSKQAQVRRPSDPTHTLERFLEDYGYLLVTASAQALRIDFHGLGTGAAPLDTVTVRLVP